MSVKKDFIMPIVVLLFICLFVSGALAIVNIITSPVIEAATRQRAAEEKKVIMPQADEFEILDIYTFRSNNNFPRTITEIHRALNDTGYIFAISVIGYGSDEIKLLCGVDPDGKIIRATVLSHSETQGLGTPIFEQPHAGQYWGRDRSGIDGISAIAGATITSNAFKKAMTDALIAFEIVTGGY
jgi:electron transport complex protein RnfG